MDLKSLLAQLSIDSPYIIEDGGNEKLAYWLDGKNMLTKEGALSEAYSQLGLVEYLSHKNYDGFEELLQPDLWPNQAMLSIGIRNSREFVEHGDPEVVKTLFEIFHTTGDVWKADHNREFCIRLV